MGLFLCLLKCMHFLVWSDQIKASTSVNTYYIYLVISTIYVIIYTSIMNSLGRVIFNSNEPK